MQSAQRTVPELRLAADAPASSARPSNSSVGPKGTAAKVQKRCLHSREGERRQQLLKQLCSMF
eukprot:9532589-Alexandrium_andersonii.AAC.1